MSYLPSPSLPASSFPSHATCLQAYVTLLTLLTPSVGIHTSCAISHQEADHQHLHSLTSPVSHHAVERILCSSKSPSTVRASSVHAQLLHALVTCRTRSGHTVYNRSLKSNTKRVIKPSRYLVPAGIPVNLQLISYSPAGSCFGSSKAGSGKCTRTGPCQALLWGICIPKQASQPFM